MDKKEQIEKIRSNFFIINGILDKYRHKDYYELMKEVKDGWDLSNEMLDELALSLPKEVEREIIRLPINEESLATYKPNKEVEPKKEVDLDELRDIEFTVRNILSLHLNNFYQENGLSVSCKTRTVAEDKIISAILPHLQKPVEIRTEFEPTELTEEDRIKFGDALKRMNKQPLEFKPVESDAVEFAEWIVRNTEIEYIGGWKYFYRPENEMVGKEYTEKELYEQFKQLKK